MKIVVETTVVLNGGDAAIQVATKQILTAALRGSALSIVDILKNRFARMESQLEAVSS
ncbi:hypothetical protein NKJ55_22120 [Mesorhizobium sp. M0106]|uniref:hypothetical protein n=1 Tax=Mesorhizobium sp. M0106 TaxID=2956880 RepID=UPI003339F736